MQTRPLIVHLNQHAITGSLRATAGIVRLIMMRATFGHAPSSDLRGSAGLLPFCAAPGAPPPPTPVHHRQVKPLPGLAPWLLAGRQGLATRASPAAVAPAAPEPAPSLAEPAPTPAENGAPATAPIRRGRAASRKKAEQAKQLSALLQLPQRVSSVPGVGPKYEQLLGQQGVRTVDDLMRMHVIGHARRIDVTAQFLKVGGCTPPRWRRSRGGRGQRRSASPPDRAHQHAITWPPRSLCLPAQTKVGINNAGCLRSITDYLTQRRQDLDRELQQWLQHQQQEHQGERGPAPGPQSAQQAVPSWLKPKVTLSVEGNISAGKSTFLRILEGNGLLDTELQVTMAVE